MMTIKRCSKGSIPIVKQFLAENFVRSKMIPKMVLFRGNGGLDVRLYVRDLEKAHPLAEPRVLVYFLRQNPSRAIRCSKLQEPPPKKPKKLTHFGTQSNSCAETKRLGGS